MVIHLGYHYLRDGSAPGPNCTPRRFRHQIERLFKEGYTILTCGEVSKRIIAEKPLPNRYATISFDDGLKDQYTTALPILQEYGVPATFFCISCVFNGQLPPVIGFQILIELLGAERLEKEILPKVFRGTPYLELLDPKRYDASNRKMGEKPENRRIKWMFNHWASQALKQEKLDEMFAEYLGEGTQGAHVQERFLSAGELREMHAAGMEIGSHTVTHPAMDITGLAEIDYELGESYRLLGEILTREAITSFAWPFGGVFRPAARALVCRYYTSAWNFSSQLKVMPEEPYELNDIPRLNEQAFDPAS